MRSPHPPALLLALVLTLELVLVSPHRAADAAAARSELERRAEDVLTDLHDVARTEPGRFGHRTARQAPLTGWSDLREVAREWADEMGQRRQLSHSPAAERPICCAVRTAENVGYRTLPSLDPGAVVAAARGLFQGWMDSPGHRATITDGRFDEVGVGVRITPQGSGHVLYVTAEFRDRDPSRVPDGVVYHRPARAIGDTCDGAGDAGYRDVGSGNVHRTTIDCVTAHGIATGTSERRYEPAGALNRAQLATFLVRTLRAGDVALPSRPGDHFADDDGLVHEHNLNVLAEIGVVDRSDRRVGPAVVVTREEMARWTAAALVHGGGLDPDRRVGDHFGDDDGSGAQSAINRLADAGIVTGAGDGTFGPRVPLRRDQMATFLARGLDLLLDT
jgi:hypothetical protein